MVQRFFKKPIYAKRVNLLEKDEEEIHFEGKEIRLDVKPFEIVSLELKFLSLLCPNDQTEQVLSLKGGSRALVSAFKSSDIPIKFFDLFHM